MIQLKSIPLDKSHNRKDFACGKQSLDTYFHQRVSQDVKRQVARCFVLLDATEQVCGYYTLSTDAIPRDTIADQFLKQLPHYGNIPTILLGRLVIDEKYHGQGLGRRLLFDALYRCYLGTREFVAWAVVVDPLDEDAKAFYHKYDFVELPDSGRMIIPMKKVNTYFKEG